MEIYKMILRVLLQFAFKKTNKITKEYEKGGKCKHCSLTSPSCRCWRLRMRFGRGSMKDLICASMRSIQLTNLECSSSSCNQFAIHDSKLFSTSATAVENETQSSCKDCISLWITSWPREAVVWRTLSPMEAVQLNISCLWWRSTLKSFAHTNVIYYDDCKNAAWKSKKAFQKEFQRFMINFLLQKCKWHTLSCCSLSCKDRLSPE